MNSTELLILELYFDDLVLLHSLFVQRGRSGTVNSFFTFCKLNSTESYHTCTVCQADNDSTNKQVL